MYIMCVILCLFSALSRRVGALQISIIIIIIVVVIVIIIIIIIIIYCLFFNSHYRSFAFLVPRLSHIYVVKFFYKQIMLTFCQSDYFSTF